MRKHTRVSFLAVLLMVVVAGVGAAQADAEAPVKEIFNSHIGWEVNEAVPGSNVCSTGCRLATASSEPGGFEYPEGVAAAPDGNIYVAELASHRVQELSGAGEFIATFGKEVNEDGKDVCTAGEAKSAGTKCRTGAESGEAGGFITPHAVTVEPAGTEEDVYVQDLIGWAIDKYTPSGTFLYRIGKEVNETKVKAVEGKGGTPTPVELEEENLCTAASHDVCKSGVEREPESTEHAAFNFGFSADPIAVGGSQHLVYVGDERRIQEFSPDGSWAGEIELPSAISSLAVDEKDSILYVIYNEEPMIHEFSLATGEELGSTIEVAKAALVRGLSVDPTGRLAVSALTTIYGPEGEKTFLYGNLYEAGSNHILSEIRVPEGSSTFTNLTFNGDGALYASSGQEILSYLQLPVAGIETGAASCSPGSEQGTSDTFSCSLGGTIDPYGVPGTEALFEWGRTCSFGSTTSGISFASVEEPIQMSKRVEGLRPNEKNLCFRAVGHDQNAESPETLAGSSVSFVTEAVPPKVLATAAQFPTSSSAVLFAELNPENAPTVYHFELAAEPNAAAKLAACQDATMEKCTGVLVTSLAESSAYGIVGATLEANGLQPSTEYLYRFNADNGEEANKALRAVSDIGAFTTLGSPVVEASTGLASLVTATTAHVEGVVNPDGAQATYSFELGTYQGSGTQYDVAWSGSTGVSRSGEAKSFTFVGLQPGVTYSYRISIHSGYGTAVGAPATFTTSSVGSPLTPGVTLPQLPVPKISFPSSQKAKCKAGFDLNKRHKCVKREKVKKKRKHKFKKRRNSKK